MTITPEAASAYECAENFGTEYPYTAYIDSASPPTRVLTGKARVFYHPDPKVGAGVIIGHARSFPDGFKAGYLIDDGERITVALPVGWHERGNYVITRFHQRGMPIIPRRYYYLKLEAA